MTDSGDSDGFDALLAAVGHSPDDELAAAAARSRSRRRWLRQQAAESSTMAGILLTLAERDDPVTIRCGPWAPTGHLRRVTAALTVVELTEGIALVPTHSISAVEAPEPVADDRVPSEGPDLAAVLASLVAERTSIRLQLDDGTETSGLLADLGKDVALVRLTSSIATVRLSAVAVCILPGLETWDPAG